MAKDTKAGRLAPTRCLLSEFVRLLTPHVPDLYRHAIRYFGLLAPGAKGNKWAGLFVVLGQKMKTPPSAAELAGFTQEILRVRSTHRQPRAGDALGSKRKTSPRNVNS